MIDKKSVEHLRRLVKIWCKVKEMPTKFIKKDIEQFIKLENK